MTERNLARNSRGTMIHTRDCRFAKHPWLWADTVSGNQVFASIIGFGYRTCRYCKPAIWTDDERAASQETIARARS